MDFFSHQLKTRFVTCLALVDGVRESVKHVAPSALRAPHCAADCLDDLTGQVISRDLPPSPHQRWPSLQP